MIIFGREFAVNYDINFFFMFVEFLQGIISVHGGQDSIAKFLEECCDHVSDILIIFGNQYSLGAGYLRRSRFGQFFFTNLADRGKISTIISPTALSLYPGFSEILQAIPDGQAMLVQIPDSHQQMLLLRVYPCSCLRQE